MMKLRLFIYFLLLALPSISVAQNSDVNFPQDTKYAYSYQGNTIITEAERQAGTTYKVEVLRLPFFDKNDPGLKDLKEYGTLHLEKWKENDEYVLLLGTFKSQSKAQSIKKKLINQGFNEARIISYRDGLRN